MSKNTPVNDYITEYENSGVARFHIPGHKGRILQGLESRDITEIKGADYLFEATGIIAKSEELTSEIYGSAKTLYSTEGSTLSIKTMLGIIKTCIKDGGRTLVLAPRNVHKAFIDGCCLLDIDVKWIYTDRLTSGLCVSFITPDNLKQTLAKCDKTPDAVYITSPDYLGNMADVEQISKVCKSFGVPLLVDNAHGAYLKFLEKSLHPLDMGADMCVDSAHKTLPVYTGGSYLHIAKNSPKEWLQSAKETMSLFASTSPSYLIMASLDRCCGELKNGLIDSIRACAKKVAEVATTLNQLGWDTKTAEPLKLTVYPAKNGYSGDELADVLREHKIECEYSDTDCVVLMCSPFNDEKDYQRLVLALNDTPKRLAEPIDDKPYLLQQAKVKMSIRQAYFSPHKKVAVDEARGRICARPVVSCQPSVPIVIPGEQIDDEIIKILKRYSIFYIDVI